MRGTVPRATLFALLLAAPPRRPSDRTGAEFARLPAWYRVLGAEFDPLK